MKLFPFALICLVFFTSPALATVIDSTENGFTIAHKVEINGSADRVYQAFVSEVNQWWDKDHTWSGFSENLFIEKEVNGCFCERLPEGGGVEHMRIVNISPGKSITLKGGLGPLQEMAVTASMKITFVQLKDKMEITLTYSVGGYFAGGLQQLAGPVDMVLGGQIDRLKKYVEDGVKNLPGKKESGAGAGAGAGSN